MVPSVVTFEGVSARITSQSDQIVTLHFEQDLDLVVPLSGQLCQSVLDCRPQGVTAALLEFWNPIWNRDGQAASEDLEHWPAFRHLVAAVPAMDPLDLDLTDVAVWRHAVNNLKASAAVGVCGWHNAELKALPDRALGDLARLSGGHCAPTFPAHLLQAKVAAISKVPFPTSAAQARPITVLSCLYRLWGRVVCLQAIRCWSLSLPRPIMGFLKGRSAVDLSYWILQETESALCMGQDLSGVALDLRRAFNCIPRPPARHLLALLGLPVAVIQCWADSLPLIRRSFVISTHLSPGLNSTTGCPEGDPVSVLGMLALCYAFVHLVQPFASPRCYADNWSWLSDLPEAHVPAMDTCVSFISSLSMEIDWSKSYFWATFRCTRTWWKRESQLFLPQGATLEVVSQIKELGAHFSFNRRTSLGHLLQQFQSAVDRLHRLFHEPSSVQTKCRLVQAGVWTHAFYGALATAPGLHRMQFLRANAARAIVGRHHTLSAHAALFLLPAVQDPEVFLMCAQALQLRRTFACMPWVASEVLALATSGRDFPSVYGPSSGPGHAFFNFRTSTPLSIRTAIEAAWAQTVQDRCTHRTGLARLMPPCPLLSRHVLSQRPAWQQLILARHMTGAFMSGAEKSAWSSVETGVCCLCGGHDTKSHRLFYCPSLTDVRRPFEPLLTTVRETYPEWVHLFAATEHDLQGLLRLITCTRALPPLLPAPADSSITLFTDGSAMHPDCPPARMTYWSVVVSSIDSSLPSLAHWASLSVSARAASFRVLVQGSTPGCQTIPRAELAAVSWAASWLLAHVGIRAVLYTDSAYVVHVWTTLAASVPPLHLRGDADLIAPLSALARSGRLEVRKVKAHNPEGTSEQASPQLRFATEGNTAADVAAKQAAAREDVHVRETADAVARHYREQSDHMHCFATFLVELNVEETRRKEALTRGASFVPEYDQARVKRDFFAPRKDVAPSGTFVQFCGSSHLVLGLPYGDEFMLELHKWAASLVWPALPVQPGQDGAITFLELCVRFCTDTRMLPPVPLHSGNGSSQRKFVSALSDTGMLQHIDFWVLTSTFVEAVETARRVRNACYFPASKVLQLPNLRALGLRWDLPGISVRPRLGRSEVYQQCLVAICEEGNILPLLRHCRGPS